MALAGDRAGGRGWLISGRGGCFVDLFQPPYQQFLLP